jgi:hypothetical protein
MRQRAGYLDYLLLAYAQVAGDRAGVDILLEASQNFGRARVLSPVIDGESV